MADKKEVTMNKATLTDLAALGITLIALFVPAPLHKALLYTGLFALSGALTNHLAVHMLFHRIPLLYGSGVIERNFEAFKAAVSQMIMREFFTKERLDAFLQNEERRIDLKPLIEKGDFNPAFDALVESVMESKFGSAVQLFGGKEALEGLRESFISKLKGALLGVVGSETFTTQLHALLSHSSFGEDMQETIAQLVTTRLEQLDPREVKRIVEQLIAEHLGWLVLWGGVFGGLIGLLSSLVL